jgi:hypothetical protein
MSKLTRRGFLGKTSAGAATLGALLMVPGLAEAAPSAPRMTHLGLTKEELEGPVLVHVRDLKTGELAILVGEREIVFNDSEFVNRLGKAAQRATPQSK